MSNRLPVEMMLKDATAAEALASHDPGGLSLITLYLRDMACHVRALASECERLEAALLRIAARGGDWSPADLHAHVADALGVTVAELERMLRGGP